MKSTKQKVFSIELKYNIEADDATKALDQVLGMHPVKPIAFSCEPVIIDEDEDDD